ncbi:11158_t:CDS:2 [Funneliformis geosporum]|nr:11158_t:CDS:2 [Funneliformis geosporum]
MVSSEVQEQSQNEEKAFSSYNSFKDFKDVLKQFKINGNSISDIKQFSPDDIKRKIEILTPLYADDNEAKRSEFIISGLYSAIHKVKRITNEKVTLQPQRLVSWEENCGKMKEIRNGFTQCIIQCDSSCQENSKKRTTDMAFGYYDYLCGIVSTGAEWYFILSSMEGISCTSSTPYYIKFNENALIKDSEEERKLRKDVKKNTGNNRRITKR